MKLAAWMSKRRGRQAQIASSTGMSAAYVWQIAHEIRPIPVERCAEIERVTGDEVRRWDLRPNDWHLIWPELIGLPGSPAIPEREVANV